ncbi:amidohydrolase family protein [Larsenimonas rhizosphaerae]|uniref:Amidohydrolase family protein n=1 Tax=Larsenimonas rhizosphaerae TaxID=2944682 RepID=A0AA41ZEC2_9GAMM|nr:amidohydrolase family protein [Larsenimonas rhizosphaerae]MCX2522925.1 amidohydrolase family protein [Larsenimonas rhizosphaerae]
MTHTSMSPACDCHIHVFDRDREYIKATYQPPRKSIGHFMEEAAVSDIRRAVLIQASIDGTDNHYLLETLRQARLPTSPLELRGVVMIDEHTSGLEAMREAGVRGIRIQDRTRLGQHDLARLPELAARAAALDWHVELNTEPERYDVLAALLPTLPEGQTIVLDHFGHVTPGHSDELTRLCRLLDTGRVWIKLAPTRVSQQPGRYDDLIELTRHLAERYRECCLWGSDWPHVMTPSPIPGSLDMIEFLERALSSPQRQACLRDNPERLYRF